MAVCAVASVLSALMPTSATAGSLTYAGTLASSGASSLRSSLIVAGTGLTRTIAIIEADLRSGTRVTHYHVDMQKRMHLIIVSDDLTHFMHIHPTLDADGTFRIATTFPANGAYHLYADAVPRGFGHEVFRFDVPIDATAKPVTTRPLAPAAAANAGPYSVRLSADNVKAGVDNPMLIAITENGEPASDLHPYLGAYAHVVAIGAKDLSYTHIHAMAMSSMAGMSTGDAPPLPANAAVPATMPIHVTLPRAGTYKVWVQFIGGPRLYAAPFVIEAT